MPTEPAEGCNPSYSPPRRWPRFAVSLSMRVRVSTPAGSEFVLAHGRDVSQLGMAVYVPVELKIGDITELELPFPGLNDPLTILARVQNREGFKYGVEFLNPTSEQQNIILTHLHKLVE